MKRKHLTTKPGCCGQHLFTSVAIAKGEPFYDFVDAKIFDHSTYQTVQVGSAEHSLDNGPLLCTNHSCNPNVFVDVQRRCCYALRDIQANEELTFFYPSTEWEMDSPFECLCGSEQCIGTISGAKHLPEEILQRYKINTHILTLKNGIDIRLSNDADIEQIKNFSDRIFGSGYGDKLFMPGSSHKQFDDILCFVAIKDENVVGLTYCELMKENPLEKFKALGFDVSEMGKNINALNTPEPEISAYYNALLVDEKHRGLGLAASLYAKLCQAFSRINVRNAYATAWKENPNPAIFSFLGKRGWKSFSTKESFWYEDSLKKGYDYHCVRCGNPPCSCSAILIHLHLSDGICRPIPIT